MTQVEGSIKKYIENKFLRGDAKKSISTEESLLDSGLIDSMGIFELVAFLEKEFDIEITDEDLVPDNFESLNLIASMVTKRIS